MLLEHNVITAPYENALLTVFGVQPTSLDEGLKTLADAQPEQLPQDGVGGLERKRFWADISGSAYGPEELMDQFRRRITEVIPIEFSAEPGAPQEAVHGATLTASLPLRGNIQIRVEEVTPREITFATLRGHPLAGVVRFAARQRENGVLRFTVSVFARAATTFDWVAMNTVGGVAQNSNWRTALRPPLCNWPVGCMTNKGQDETEGRRRRRLEFDKRVRRTPSEKRARLGTAKMTANHRRTTSQAHQSETRHREGITWNSYRLQNFAEEQLRTTQEGTHEVGPRVAVLLERFAGGFKRPVQHCRRPIVERVGERGRRLNPG